MLKPESAETFMQEYSEPNSHWFESLAEHLREAYLRYSCLLYTSPSPRD